MSAQILLKSGKTNPPKNALNQRELGINTSTAELFIGTVNGEAKQIASVPFVSALLQQTAKTSVATDVTSSKNYILNDNYVGLFIVKNDTKTAWYAICQSENSVSYTPIIDTVKNVSVSTKDNTISIQSEGSSIITVTFCGSISLG